MNLILISLPINHLRDLTKTSTAIINHPQSSLSLRAENVRVLLPEVVTDEVAAVLDYPAPHRRAAALRLHLDPLPVDGGALTELLGLVVVVHPELREQDLVLVLCEGPL